ncbi:MAG: outer membrane beta-barrel protein [Nitrospiraceae bacterium]
MRTIPTVRFWCALFCISVAVGVIVPPMAHAQERGEGWKWTPGGVEQGRFMVGVRGGFSLLTQELRNGTDTDVGSVANFQGMYSLNKWLLVGLTVEWERRAVDTEIFDVSLGHLDTISVLPTVELRPGRLGPIAPYASMGFGVNVNSFGVSSNLPGLNISPDNTFSWRLAWGGDYFITNKIALNTEMAYKINNGDVTINGVESNDWNASSFNFLFGLRMFF